MLLIGAPAFLLGWGYAIASWGWFLGIAFGWFPAFFFGLILGLLWPLVVLLIAGIVLLLVYKDIPLF